MLLGEVMRVFISWAGEQSKQVANVLRRWLPTLLQSTRPFVSTWDIETGADWLAKLKEAFGQHAIIIVCGTKESIASPWVLFETGAISRSEKSRLITLLCNITEQDLVRHPLSSFQHMKIEKEAVHKLLLELNDREDEARVDPGVIEKTLDTFWPEFVSEINGVLAKGPETAEREITVKETLGEILRTVQSLARRPAFSKEVIKEIANEVSLIQAVRLAESFRSQRLSDTGSLSPFYPQGLGLIGRPLGEPTDE